MKKVLLATLVIVGTLVGCKDDTPVDNSNNNSSSDLRDNVVGNYSCDYKLFEAKSGNELKKGSFELKIYKNSDDATLFDFREDGLVKFMSGANLKKVSGGYSFDIPQQEVDGFGNLKGRELIIVPDQTNRVAGYYTPANGNITVYCERETPVGADDELYEFIMVKK